VQSNTRSSRQHLVELGGCGWIRLRVTKAVGSKIKLNFDIHDASQGVSDSWIFIGDSITQCGMVNQTGTSFAAHIHALNPDYYPAAENAGISGLTSADGKASIDGWLDGSPVRYVSIAYGTNDCWGHSDGAASFYANTKYMIDAVLKRGKVPVLPTIPYASSQKVGPNLPACSEKVQQLYAEYGSRLVHGPELETFFREHPDLLSSDGIHPSEEGYAAMRKLWAETMYEAVYAEPAAVTGDLNADGALDMRDFVLLSRFLTADAEFDLVQMLCADVSEDCRVNAIDLTVLKQLALSDGRKDFQPIDDDPIIIDDPIPIDDPIIIDDPITVADK
jgi:lysophospholipase L1-like esterase